MFTPYVLTTLGLVPYFASRAFVPLFATVLVARFGTEWSFLAGFLGVELLDRVPAWAVSNQVLLVLGLAALAEIAWTKNPELRETIGLADPVLKGLVALALALLLAPEAAAAASPVQQAGFVPGPLAAWAAVVAGLTFFLASLRNRIYGFLMEIDDEDDLGLQGVLSWMEDGIGFLGVLFVVLLPAVALIVAGLTLLGLFLVERLLERRERRGWVACPECGEAYPPCGLVCARCGADNPEPRQVGWLGTIRRRPAIDRQRHRLDLLSRKRCRRCGHRLRGKSFDLSCQRCGVVPFETEADLEAYLALVKSRLPKVLTVLLAFSAVPVVGLVPGVIYYRLSLISSLRHYVPRGSRIAARWLGRLAALVLILLQWIPFLGAASLPLLALVNYRIYRRLLLRAGDDALARRSLPAAT